MLSLLFAIVRPAAATIRYTISLAHPGQHIFAVAIAIPRAPQSVALPAWNALYQVRDFAYRVRDPRCEFTAPAGAPAPPANSAPCSLRKLDKQTWQILPLAPASAAAPAVTIRYTIEWNDPGPFDSQLNPRHAFLNFAELLMYAPARRAEPVDVAFTGVPANWKMIAALPAGDEPRSFSAATYDKLVDAPAEFGQFDQFDFDQAGAHFRVVVDASNWSKRNLEDDLRRITAYELALMGGPPFREYTFFFHIGPPAEAGGGGMEHSNCSAIAADSVEAAATIAAHEFFHAWNVKRIRPQSLEPVDFTREQYTRALWFAEGVTSTYAAYTLVRAGLWSRQEFYDDLARQIGQLQSRPARLWQSVEESSLGTWFDKYDFYGRPSRSISYYNKGQILGVLLDLEIRHSTANRKSLDDVLRLMNDQYAKAGKFYDDSAGIEAAVEQVAGRGFAGFFRRYVSGTDELPYAEVLSLAGLELHMRTIRTADLAFTPSFAPGSSRAQGILVGSVAPGGPAEAAGLQPGDVITQFNARPVPRNRAALLRDLSPGRQITLTITRARKSLHISYALASTEATRYSIAESPHPTPAQRQIRNS
ncbi:MAG TPA: PDZ domain-containing protein, partial [Candidatus Acidoferrales bacterium]|nr:PDZ domain-containing protein [Candidatus Acidoferrales bacterium]